MTLIVQLADLHFGAEDQDAIDIAAQEIHRLKPDAIAVCGDLTQRGKTSEFESVRDWLDQFKAPKLVVPGNHDTPMLNLPARITEPFARFDQAFSGHARPLSVRGLQLRGLNTARGWQARRNWAEGSVRLDDLAAQANAETGAGENLLALICHHPFLAPPGAPLHVATRRGGRASDLMSASAARLLLTGHVHTPSAAIYETQSGRYLNVTSGTLSKRRRKSPSSFNILDIDRGAVRVDVIECAPGAHHRRRLGVWSP